MGRGGVIEFANPNLVCMECLRPIRGWAQEQGPGPGALIPCGHRSDAVSSCSSWGPVDGCTCPGHPHADTWQSPTIGRRCGRCTIVSWHPKDVEEGYCGRCCDWTPGHLVQRGAQR